MLDTMRKRMGDGPFSVALRDGQSGDIEVCEIESIRGRSFDENAWLIIDEAQQTTKDEMIAIITRISDSCRLTVCGDPHQKDIRGESGLEWLLKFIRRHNLEAGIVEFTSDDIVRGDFVKSVVKGLEKDGEFN
jgi:phosphate starvation-inducible PhoH-like protein